MSKIHIFTDGACSGNPGPGGWGAVIQVDGQERELMGGDPSTTNNRMELTAAIEAIKTIPEGSTIDLFTDSTYVRDGITVWTPKWIQNGWKTSQNKPVKNQDLWEILCAEAKKHKIVWHWVKAHAGHKENERADFLARHAIVQTVMGGNHDTNQSAKG